MLRGQRSSELIAFTELILVFGYQFCVAIFTVLWFKGLGKDDTSATLVLIPIILANAGAACVQVALNLFLLRGVDQRDAHYCKIWYYTCLVFHTIFVVALFFGVIFYPILAQWLGVPIVFIVYRTVSLKILKDYIAELNHKNRKKEKPVIA